jgi:hypothetical protein
VPLDLPFLLPSQYGVRGELGAVVADDHARASPDLDDVVKFTHHAQSGGRGVHDQAQAFPGKVVDHGKDAEAPATDQRIHHEVERPAQVLILRDRP